MLNGLRCLSSLPPRWWWWAADSAATAAAPWWWCPSEAAPSEEEGASPPEEEGKLAAEATLDSLTPREEEAVERWSSMGEGVPDLPPR